MKIILSLFLLGLIEFSQCENNSTLNQWTPKIIGGQNAAQNQFPYMAALFLDYYFRCGSSIIRSNFVLTAAHCISGYSSQRFFVQTGSIYSQAYSGPTYSVERLIIHERYGNGLNDIALIKIRGQFNLGPSAQIIPINKVAVPDSAPVVIVGWGITTPNGPVSRNLKWVTLRNLGYYQCLTYNKPGIICIAHNGYQGACSGDSGGPAVYSGRLIGVANFVINYCGSNYADGYADVSYYSSWIETRMNQYRATIEEKEDEMVFSFM